MRLPIPSLISVLSVLALVRQCIAARSYPPDYRCTNHDECNIKHPSLTCCAQVSCNGGYGYYRFTSGCAKMDHCQPDSRYNSLNGQYSARLPFEWWFSIQTQLGANLHNCSQIRRESLVVIDDLKAELQDLKTRAAKRRLFNVPPPPPGAAFFQSSPIVQRRVLCDSNRERECARVNRFCCIRVTCSDTAGDYDLEDVCVLPGGCALRKLGGGQNRKGRHTTILWFTGQQWTSGQRDYQQSGFADLTVNLEASCSETKTFHLWLKKFTGQKVAIGAVRTSKQNGIIVRRT